MNVNDFVRSRMRENRTYGSVRGWRRKAPVYSIIVMECACGTGLLSQVIAKKCRSLIATDFSPKMLEKARKNCSAFDNITFIKTDIMSLDYPNGSFDKVVAGNVIHLLDEPLKALSELDRVCRPGEKIIIPTYMNKDRKGQTSGFALLGMVLENVYDENYENLINEYLQELQMTDPTFENTHKALYHVGYSDEDMDAMNVRIDDIGMAWILDNENGFIWHNGGTESYNSYLGFCSEKDTAVVILSNLPDDHRISATEMGARLLTEVSGDGSN